MRRRVRGREAAAAGRHLALPAARRPRCATSSRAKCWSIRSRAGAVVEATPFGRTMGNIYLRVARPGRAHAAVYRAKPRALAWLRAFVPGEHDGKDAARRGAVERARAHGRRRSRPPRAALRRARRARRHRPRRQRARRRAAVHLGRARARQARSRSRPTAPRRRSCATSATRSARRCRPSSASSSCSGDRAAARNARASWSRASRPTAAAGGARRRPARIWPRSRPGACSWRRVPVSPLAIVRETVANLAPASRGAKGWRFSSKRADACPPFIATDPKARCGRS